MIVDDAWHIYGYGLCLNKIKGLEKCLKLKYMDLFKECDNDWFEFFNGSCNNDIITVSDDGEGYVYLYYNYKYPWEMTPEEKDFKNVEDIEEYIVNFLSEFMYVVPKNVLIFEKLNIAGSD